LACGADGLGSAPGKRIACAQGCDEVWSLPLDSSSRHPFFMVAPTLGLVILKPSDKDGRRISTANGADPVLPNVASPLTTVLRIMVSQLRLSRLLAFIQCHPFPLGQLPQPGKVPAPDAGLGEILFESLTFQTA